MATESSQSEIETIRRQMAQIRREIHEDVQGMVVNAEAATDWRSYVRQHPWAAVGVAVVLGYLVVPHRRHKTDERVADARPASSHRERAAVQEAKAEKKARRAGLVGSLFGMLGPVLLRAGQNYAQSYASQFLENWIAQQGGLGPLGPLMEAQNPPQAPPRPNAPRGGMGGPGMPPPGWPGTPGGPRRA